MPIYEEREATGSPIRDDYVDAVKLRAQVVVVVDDVKTASTFSLVWKIQQECITKGVVVSFQEKSRRDR